MRSDLYALVLAGALAGCAAPQTGRVCTPVASWASPAYRCVTPEGAPAPVVEAPVEPTPPAPAEVQEETIDLKEKVEFETDSAQLKEGSKPVLDGVVKVLKEHPEILKIRIEGHTDSTSTPEHNQTLSEQRAAAVREYFTSQGIAAGRLSSKGLGQTKPIDDNNTESGRAANRRVEIHIVDRKK
jgi:outer membrane protein OmpA-like peptidoglycan-associated protein